MRRYRSAVVAATLVLALAATSSSASAESAATSAAQAPVAQVSGVPTTFGVGTVNGRVRTWMSASGVTCPGNKVGNFLSIASALVGFGTGLGSVAVSTAFGLTGLAVSNSSTVRVTACTAERYTWRDGEGHWSSDPNTAGYWHLGYRTGKAETYRIVTTYTQNPTTLLWTGKTYNYPTPSRVQTSPNYGSSTSWLINKAVDNVTAGTSYIETAW